MDKAEIKRIVLQEIGKIVEHSEDIGPTDELGARGLDSLRSVELTLQLEDAFGIYFEDDEIHPSNFVDIESIATLLEAKLNAAA